MTATRDLPPLDHAARRDALRARLPDVSHLLVTDPVNVRYLTGFTGSNGVVIVGADAAADRLLSDARYDGRAGREASDIAVEVARDPVAATLSVASRLGLEAAHVPHARWLAVASRAADAGVEVVAVDGLVEALREVKDAGEVARLARACALTDAAFTWLLAEEVAVGRSERSLARALERRFVDLGADGVAFDSIVASGPNSAVPHHRPTDRRLAAGDLLIVDAGAEVDGYHADCTRTVALGHPGDDLVRIQEVVVAAQAAGRAAAQVGARAGEVDTAAHEVVEAAGLGHGWAHGTGHGVGLAVHEAPAVGRGVTARLLDHTVLTVEPGVYLPGVGGVRVEDTLVVLASGSRPLTDTPRGLRVLPATPARR